MRTAVILAILLGSAPAFAQQSAGGSAQLGTSGSVSTDSGTPSGSSSEDDPTIPGALVVGAEVGAIFPQPFTELGSHVAFGIELGYRLPFADQRLEIMFDAGFSPPQNHDTVARTEGDYDIKVTEQELHFSLGPRVHIMERSSPWNVTIAAGGRLFLLKSWSNGDRDGQKFAEFYEQSTQMGFFAALGGEYILGPGAIFLDVDFGWSKLPHTITGKVNTGNLTPTLGYRFFLL
jgi:hypothetical protein